MIVLGSTGSIGVNALNIAKRFNLEVEALSANRNINLLNKQIEEFKPKMIVIFDENLKSIVNHTNIFVGDKGMESMLKNSESRIVVNSIVGFAGLKSTLAVLNLNKELALANKESLVVAGAFIKTENITPIDSEHFGLWYLLQDKKIKKMTITASGGAFRDSKIDSLKYMKAKDALKHPNWAMGQKITIDSATMINKLFELIEARWLFGEGEYEAIIETRSMIHAIVDFADGSSVAHIAKADMKLPIAYALLKRVDESIVDNIDLTKIKELEFREIDSKRYPIWSIKDDILKNPKLGVVVNAANEIAVEAFLRDEIGFLDISKIVLNAFEKFNNIKINSLNDVFEVDAIVRNFAKESLK